MTRSLDTLPGAETSTRTAVDVARWRHDGFLLLDPGLASHALHATIAAAEAAFASHGSRAAGVRNSLKLPAMRDLALNPAITALAAHLSGPGAFITRAILFDKSPDANWDVGWHQDTAIAVESRVDVTGFGPWSVKAGVTHVNPPAEVLAGMATLRIHLDPCGPENGPLLVVPGSHARGLLENIDPVECERRAVCCAVPAGGVVAMRPLLLHASRKAAAPVHRRVLHLEFAAEPLPGGLRWARA